MVGLCLVVDKGFLVSYIIQVVTRGPLTRAYIGRLNNLATVLTAKEFGERLGLQHLEVIRRIRRGDIKAQKLGWFWVIDAEEETRVRDQDWYKRVMARRAREVQATA
jgi:hypothetical protein